MLDKQNFDLIVVGGGAAGFFGALACAGANPLARIAILEKAGAVLGKVRISGGGRCNLTHACFDPAELVGYYPRGAKELRSAFTRFQPADTIRWFENHGVRLKTEADSRIFPLSNSSETVIDCLTSAAGRSGIQVRTRFGVAAVERVHDETFRLYGKESEVLHSRSLLLACGGERAGFDLAASLGHQIVPPVPSLFTFKVNDSRLRGLQGISAPAAHLSLPVANLNAAGPLLVTHWGLSGPAVLRLSAWGARTLFENRYQMELRIRWISADVGPRLQEMRLSGGRKQIAAQSPFNELPLRLWQHLVEAAGIPHHQLWANLSRAQLQALTMELVDGSYQIDGKGAFKEEFVTCGGVALHEVDFRSMQSRVTPRLYLAGEILDIDGLTGGFNFQNAWTTAWIAGNAIGGNK